MGTLRLAYFGLPLAASLLVADGHALELVVLPPLEGPGRRRLRRTLPPHVPLVDLLDGDPSADPTATAARIDGLLERCRPDWIVSWFWTRRFSAAQLACASRGALGAHPSLLPRHRGPNPYFAAIDAGDELTGVTIHRLTERYDEGAILSQEAIPVGTSDSWQLARRLDRPSLRQLRQVLSRLERGEEMVEVPQDEAAASWAPEPTGELRRVDWRWRSHRVLRRLRALAPVPGLALEFGGVRFFALRAEPAADFPRALLPGEGAVVGSPPEVVVRTGDGAIRVLQAQLALDATAEEAEGEGSVVSGQGLAEMVARG
jgi:methionyl-tRNA formyltransferase